MMKHLFKYFLLALLWQISVAYGESSVFLKDLTWTELRDQINHGKTTIIIPIGGTEQNGPDMALGKHNRRVNLLSEKIALALGNAIVAPVIAYVPEGNINPPTGHMRFPGTISIPDGTFKEILENAALSFQAHGFRDIVFLGDHGGYQNDLSAAAAQLNQQWAGTQVRAHAVLEYYQTTQKQYPQALQNLGFHDPNPGAHAGLGDTSLMLALDPSLVRLKELQANDHKPAAAEGVYGDPSKASSQLGQLGVKLIVENTVTAIRKATQR